MFTYKDINLIELPDKRLRQKSNDLKLPLNNEDVELIEKMIFHVNKRTLNLDLLLELQRFNMEY